MSFCNSIKLLPVRGFILKPTETLGIFKTALYLRDRHIFMWQSLELLNVFNTLTLKRFFWYTKTFLNKLEYRFLFEIKTATFPYKTALSKANVKLNWMGGTKWTYHKERSFSITTLFFWKFNFSIRTSYKELIWYTNYQNNHIFTFRKRLSFIWGCVFSASILKRIN